MSDLICADCGSPVAVPDGYEWEDGDLCYQCQIDALQSRLASAEECLRRIREHERYVGCDEWENGRDYGHHEAAAIAQEHKTKYPEAK